MIDKRLFLTITICFGLYLAWDTFVAPPKKPKKPVATASSQPASMGTVAAAQPASSPVIAAAPATLQPNVAVIHAKASDEKVAAQFKNVGASLEKLVLTDFREGGTKRGEEKHPVNLVPELGDQPLEGTEFLVEGQPFPFDQLEQQIKGVTAFGARGDLKATAHWHLAKEPYVLELEVEVENVGATAANVNAAFRINGVFNEKTVKEKGTFEPPPDLALPVAYVDGELHKHEQGKIDSPKLPNAAWAGVDRQYFLLAAAPQQTKLKGVRFEEQRATPELIRMSATLDEEARSVAPGAKTTFAYRVYAGPKASKLLSAPGQLFEEAIDYKVWFMPLGFLSRPMLWILNQAYNVVHSYGLAILLLTLIVKLILLPVTQKSFMSMQQMKDLKPELDKIRERFPNDREKQGMETMRLYKERGVSPFGGCLPALLQMPVYFALWRTLWAAVELYQQEFLWLGDLTAKDPYYILPLLLGVVFFVQQKMSPPAGDPQQQKIMLFMMPPMMTLFMVQLPSGLVFYVLVNTLLTIAQQAYISRKFGKTPALAPANR